MFEQISAGGEKCSRGKRAAIKSYRIRLDLKHANANIHNIFSTIEIVVLRPQKREPIFSPWYP